VSYLWSFMVAAATWCWAVDGLGQFRCLCIADRTRCVTPMDLPREGYGCLVTLTHRNTAVRHAVRSQSEERLGLCSTRHNIDRTAQPTYTLTDSPPWSESVRVRWRVSAYM